MASDKLIGKRLREARERTEYSQKKLGIAAGFDKFSASPRVNHYENGRHEPDFSTIQRLAKLLKVPTAYFYAEEDQLAQLILEFSSLPLQKQAYFLKKVKEKNKFEK